MHRDVIGRAAELAAIGEFLQRARTGSAALVLDGEAGIGKTTLWAAALEAAREEGFRVLSARPSMAERNLLLGSVSDLFEAVEPDILDLLPVPQRHALDVALLRAEGTGAALDHRALSFAATNLLRTLAEASGPVLVAVDDVPWLDPTSEGILAFAARRLGEHPIGFLVARRSTGTEPPPLGLDTAMAEGRFDRIVVRPLALGEMHQLLAADLGHSLPRRTLIDVHEASDGNPFYALEIARSLSKWGTDIDPRERLPLPPTLNELIGRRIAALPRATRDALVLAAAASEPTMETLEGAGTPRLGNALRPAIAEGILVVDGASVRFSHPLLASAVLDAVDPAALRRVHARLAQAASAGEVRALHLGMAAEGADERVAAELDAAGERAASRGAIAAACDMCRRALELTEDVQGEMATQRALVLARHLLDVGRTHESRALLEHALSNRPAGELLAEVLRRLGEMCWYERDFDEGYGHVVEALDHTKKPELAARIHVLAAWISEPLDLHRAIRHVESALELLDPDRSPGPYSRALLYGAYLRLIDGQGPDQGAIERGMRMQKGVEQDDRSPVPIVWPGFMDDFALARGRYEAAVAEATALGEEADLQAFFARMSEMEVWTGNWGRADELASKALALSDRIASPTYLGAALFARGYLDAHLGRIDEARAIGERILTSFPIGFEPQRLYGHWLLGFVALSAQDFSGADQELGRASEIVDQMGQREPVRYRFHPDHAEAVIGLGELDRAEQLIARLDERSRAFPRPWILATSARCRGLLRAAGGDLDAAHEAMCEALRHHEGLDMPFERARTLLVKGRVHRRRKEKRLADGTLREALTVFEELGAPLWAERARAELARVGLRPHAPHELTETERRVAQLAARGMSSKEIAEAAFLSPKTVSNVLGRVYRKLGIASRAELGSVMAARTDADPRPSPGPS